MKFEYEIRKAQLSHRYGCMSKSCNDQKCYDHQKLEVWKTRAACCHCGARPPADSIKLATFDNTPQGSVLADQYVEFLRGQPDVATGKA